MRTGKEETARARQRVCSGLIRSGLIQEGLRQLQNKRGREQGSAQKQTQLQGLGAAATVLATPSQCKQEIRAV